MNKLVRDFIPKIIENKGKKALVHIAEKNEYKQRLVDKLLEEVLEFQENPSMEELADVLEVIDALHEAFHFSKELVYKIQSAKRLDRGGFKNRYILEKIEEGTNL